MEEFKEIFLLIKQYVDEQKENMALSTAEGITRILSVLAVAFVCTLLGSTVLLLAAFGLAYYIAEQVGSIALGFTVLALVVLLLTIIVYLRRKAWIIEPICSLISHQFTGKVSDTASLHNCSQAQKEKVKETGDELSGRLHKIMEPAPKTDNRTETAMQVARNAIKIWQGVTLGIKIVRGFRAAFGRRR